MLSGAMFDALNYLGKKFRENNFPFGGIQLVLVGDFFQLPPINKRGKRNSGKKGKSGWKYQFDMQQRKRKRMERKVRECNLVDIKKRRNLMKRRKPKECCFVLRVRVGQNVWKQ